MTYHHDRCSPFAHFSERTDQCGFTISVQAGARLIKDKKAGISEKRPGKANSLPSPTGQDDATWSDNGVVTFGKAEDDLMDICQFCCFDYGRVFTIRESRDVFANGSRKKFRALRQIADMSTDIVAWPLEDIGPIKTYGPGIWPPNTAKQFGQRRFSGRDRPHDTEHATSRQFNRQPLDCRLF